MGLFEESERLKIEFLEAYRKLHLQGLITEEQLEAVIEIVDSIDEFSREELTRRLARLMPEASQGTAGDAQG